MKSVLGRNIISSIEIIMFGLASIVLLAFNLERYFVLTVKVEYPIIVAQILFALVLFLASFSLRIFGTLYMLMYVIFSVLPIFSAAASFLLSGVILVCASIIAKGRYLASLIVFTVPHIIIFVLCRDEPYYFLQWAIVVFLSAALIGGTSRFALLRIKNLNEEIIQVRETALENEYNLRLELATELHDNTARDLALISTIAQERSKDAKTASEREEWDEIGDIARRTSLRIRPLILRISPQRQNDSFAVVLAQCRMMLSGKRIGLRTMLNNDEFVNIPPKQLRLLNLFVREGCANVLKYSPPNTTANLSVKRDGNGTIMAVLNNVILQKDKCDETVASEYGLFNLENLFSSDGAHLSTDKIGERWFLSAEIPAGPSASGFNSDLNREML